MCPVGVTDKKTNVMLLSFVDFLVVLEPDLEPHFSVFMVYELVCDVGELFIISIQ